MKFSDHVSPALLAHLDQSVTRTAALIVIGTDGGAELHVKEDALSPEEVTDILRGLVRAIDAACGGENE